MNGAAPWRLLATCLQPISLSQGENRSPSLAAAVIISQISKIVKSGF